LSSAYARAMWYALRSHPPAGHGSPATRGVRRQQRAWQCLERREHAAQPGRDTDSAGRVALPDDGSGGDGHLFGGWDRREQL